MEAQHIYEFVTPSDPITFKADDDKIAYTCALLLGNGKAGCVNTKTLEHIPTMMLFSSDPEKEMSDYVGCDMGDFIKANKQKISKCFKSFSYGSISDRETYDLAVESITDPEKLIAFKAKHEDKNRSSMSRWVQAAWKYGESIIKE